MRLGLREVAALVAVFVAGAPADATLLVYEGFNGYSDIGTSTTPNANTIGLNKTIAYAGDSPENLSIAAGLSLGNLTVSGGSASFSGGTIVAGAQMSLTSAYTGTLYGSYLFNLTTRGTASGNGMEVRIGSGDASSNIRFRSQADSRNGSTAVGITYGGSIANGSDTIATGTTYIMISRFTNVGSTLSADTTGVATNWALTASQFDAFKEAADPEGYLNSAVVGTHVTAMATVTDTTGGPFVFQSGNRVHFVQVGDAGFYDEVRYASTLAEVTPIPEPASLGLLAATAGLLALRIRRRSASVRF